MIRKKSLMNIKALFLSAAVFACNSAIATSSQEANAILGNIARYKEQQKEPGAKEFAIGESIIYKLIRIGAFLNENASNQERPAEEKIVVSGINQISSCLAAEHNINSPASLTKLDQCHDQLQQSITSSKKRIAHIIEEVKQEVSRE